MNWPQGIVSAGTASGIKRRRPDLGVIVAERPVEWAATFTANPAAAACVHWSRALLGGPLRAIVVNSGNANACTGRSGERAVEATASAAAQWLGCSPEEIAVSSTGPIGVPLPVAKITRTLPRLAADLTSHVGSFAEAILTTDTVTKRSQRSVGGASVVGVAKGAAMLAPNMATMLAFLATDATATRSLQDVLSAAVDRTFNRVCVDACESTNDSVFLLATGSGPPVDDALLHKAVEEVCRDLAEQIVRDAEGGTRVMRIRVAGAHDDDAAVALARAVASSALWRSAVHGADPNWGRVVAALGGAERALDLRSVEVRIGDELVFAHGEPRGDRLRAAAAMASGAFTLSCVVGGGPGDVEVLSTDLSPDYVTLNAGGTT